MPSTQTPRFGRSVQETTAMGKHRPGLNDTPEQIRLLQDTAHHILDDFNYVSRLADGLWFTIQDLQLLLNDLEKGFCLWGS